MSDRGDNPSEWTTTWCTTTTADVDGQVQVQADGENVPGNVDQLGLPGHYAIAAIGVNGWLLRLERGGVVVSTYTTPPTDAVTGEAGLYVDGAIARCVPKTGTAGIFEVTGTRTGIPDPVTGILATPGICLGDESFPLLTVVRSTDTVITPLGVSVGRCVGTSTITGSG